MYKKVSYKEITTVKDSSVWLGCQSPPHNNLLATTQMYDGLILMTSRRTDWVSEWMPSLQDYLNENNVYINEGM